MAVVGNPDRTESIMIDFQRLIDEIAGEEAKLGRIERFAFYDRVKTAFAVVSTSERRLYGNIIVKKGIIPPA
jgi:L-fucose mutarotase